MQIQIPTNCPCCGSTLEEVKDQLFCRNKNCDAQVAKKLEHFCNTLGIKGLGPKSLEKLNLSDVTEIFYLDIDELKDALGSAKVAEKLLTEIEKAKQADLDVILAAMSIPLIGKTAASKICQYVQTIEELNTQVCKTAGLGDKATQNLLFWVDTEYPNLKEFLPFFFGKRNKSPVIPVTASKGVVCITGKLSSYKNKSEATEALISAGYTVSDNLTKKTTVLVDEENKGSSKRKKAEEYGVTIITNLNTFLKETNT